MEKNYNIDDHLRQSLKDFSFQPANASFQAMMEKLEKKRKRRRAIILLYSGIGTVASIFLALFFYGTFSTSKQITRVAVDNGNVSQGNNNPVSFERNEKSEELSESTDKKNEISEAVMNNNYKVNFKSIAANSVYEQTKNTAITNTGKVKGLGKIKKLSSVKNDSPLKPAGQIVLSQSESQNHAQITIAEDEEKVARIETSPQIPSLDDRIKIENEINDESFYPLLPLSYSMPGSSSDTGLVATPLNPLAFEYAPDLITNTNRFRFLLAFNFNPQYSRYLLSENKRRDAIYKTSTGNSLSESYLDSKKEMNTPNFTYAYGLKAGLNIHDQWEVWLGIGSQKVRFNENLYQVTIVNTSTTMGIAPGYQSASADPVGKIKLVYTYRYYSLEIKKIMHVSPFLKLNYGAGIWLEKMSAVSLSSRSSSGTGGVMYDAAEQGTSSLSNSGCRLDIKAGAIYDFGKRWQFRLNPGIFYSPTSVYNRSYIIKQKMYGFELEALLALKLYRDK